MADVQRLNKPTRRQIRRPKKKANVMNDKRIRDSIAQYSTGGYSAVAYCTVFVVCLSLLWIRKKRFNPRWRRKQHGGIRPYWWRRQWTQQQWSYSGSNCYTSSCFSSYHMWRLSRCSTRKHCYHAMWTMDMQRFANNVSRHLWQLMTLSISAEVP